MNAFQELEAELLTGRRELRDLVAARGATHDRQTRDLLTEQIDALTSDVRRLETVIEQIKVRRLDAMLDQLEREQEAKSWLADDAPVLLDLLFRATKEQRTSNNEGHQKGAKRVPAAKKKRWSPPDLMNLFERNDS